MPAELKILRGNPGKRPVRTGQPRPAPGKPKCPPWLSQRAKKKWRELARTLEPLGLLTVIDGDTLAAYCVAWVELQDATETLEREGRTVKASTSGYLMPHPAVAMQRSALQAVRAFAALFGLDPADRSKISVTPPAGPSGIVVRNRGAPIRNRETT